MKTAPISVTLIDHCGSDLSVVNAARVSFHKEAGWEWWDEDGRGPCESPSPCGRYFNIRKLSEKDAKLITYLAKHKHTSPFNHAFISVRVKAPIFVGRQLVKHKFMPWNEVSRRYVDDEPEFYIPDVWRAKAANVKQGSSNEERVWQTLLWNCGTWQQNQNTIEVALAEYRHMLKLGICPEQARMVLPQNTMTEWVWSGTLGAFADMLKLRLDSHTQAETREVAEKIKALIAPLFPAALPALLGE